MINSLGALLCAAFLAASGAAANAPGKSSSSGSQAASGSGTSNGNPTQQQIMQQLNQLKQQQQNTNGSPPYTPQPSTQPPIDFNYTPPDAAGLYHSDRYSPYPTNGYSGSTSTAAGASTTTSRSEGPPKPATIDDARESLPSLVATFIERSGKNGVFQVQGAGSVRLDSIDQNSLRALGSGLFAAPVVVRDAAGGKIAAEVTADLSGNEWKVREIAKPAAGAGRNAAKCFADAVHTRVRAGSRGRKGFVFHDADINRDWRLKLKRIHLERLQGFGAGRSYSCVDFNDLDNGRLVDLDFYVTRGTGGCKVDGIVVHRVDGKARTTKPLPAPH